MCQWTNDSQRLILEHFDVICSSPSYIYDFALPICPSSSWLHQYYSAEFSQEIKVVKGVSAGWGICFRTVSLDGGLYALTCWKDTIAVGLDSGCIIILNAITGAQMTTLSGHTDWVRSLVFLPDGISLVSGSHDKTVKLWDMQTGGVIKTFKGHTHYISSVSISADCTTIASGSYDRTIHLWDIQTGECHHIIKQEDHVNYVCFSPLDSKHFMSISGKKIWQWDTSCQQIAPEYDGSCIAFSLDGTQFVVCKKSVVEVQSSYSKEIITKFHVDNTYIQCCCFSPDNRVVALAVYNAIHIWDITSLDPHLLEAFTTHTTHIYSLAFSSLSSLISISGDRSVKFWQIGASPTDPVPTDPKSTPPASAPVKSITLQAKDGITISSHSDGVVRIWDISAGTCKATFQTPAKDSHCMDTHLTDGRLVSVWYADEKISIWDTEKGELLRTVQIYWDSVRDLRISEDGSMVFGLCQESICAWSIWIGGIVEEVTDERDSLFLTSLPFLTIDGLRVWGWNPVYYKVMGWDFGILDSSPVELSGISRNGPHLDFIGGVRKERVFVPGVQDIVTRKVVFQLPERLAKCSDAQWDGQYLVAGYDSGEVLILECNYVSYQGSVACVFHSFL